MTKPYIPVTLLIAETLHHDLARLAIDDCRAVADFAEVVVISDRADWLRPDERHVGCIQQPTLAQYLADFWCQAHATFPTSHALVIQSDSWIIDVSAWKPEWLEYDYIGAPWWYEDGRNVGNGGFNLISNRLLAHVAERPFSYPFKMPADSVLCREYRPALEGSGFRWAPEDVAREFAYECKAPTDGLSPFGFHGMQNWPRVLTRDRLLARLSLLTEYHRENGKLAMVLAEYGRVELERLFGDLHGRIAA